MPGILKEENGRYGIDCTKAIWARDDIHDVYHACGLPHILSDADFAVETEDRLLLIEYKNASIPEARAHADRTPEYSPFKADKFDKLVRKYYDSLHYLHLAGKDKPIHYIFVLEYPKGDATSRRLLRNRLKERLPFKLQDRFEAGVKLIEAVSVVNIGEWNSDAYLGRFPIISLQTHAT